MRISARAVLAVTVAVTTVLGLGACSGGAPAPAGRTALGTTNDINPVPREGVREGGNLRLPTPSVPENWNVLSNDGNDADFADIVRPMLPQAFTIDPGGRLEVDHDFFTDVQLTSTDPQQVTYTINPKAVWSDGSPITWADIAAQAHALSGADKKYLIAINNGFDRVSDVQRGADDRQAVITFKQHYSEWRGQFSGNAMLYPKSVTGDPEAFDHGLVNGITLTAGPFAVQSIDRTQGRITLGRNPKWWGTPPKLDTITFSVLDRAAWPGALQNNELDAAWLSTSNDVAAVRTSPGVVLRRAPGNRWRQLTFNGAPGSILADRQLRVAISKAIDRSGIAAAALRGLTDTPVPLNSHIFLQGQPGYRDNSTVFDPAAAAAELDKLGWTLQGDVRVKDGRRLEIRDVMYNDPAWVQIAQIIQDNLAHVGVKMSIDVRPAQNFFSGVVIPGDFDLAQFSYQGDPFPLSSLPQIYALHPDDEQGNFGRIGSPELNDLIDRTQSELDPDKAIDLANQVDRSVFEEGHSLPLTQDPGNWGVRDNVANFGAPGLASYDYTLIGFVN
ncbi:ABC transporter family substrate-binding protein [Nocardia sp. BMG111209]|uniref:ABC transporter family substrate-binding protein n=1 Tax=Nocardia sp. BMG111209 TaxID=1160137 RepID=UPI0003A9AA8A|nr:ABC transporter family substrate-binding protein [Nocardia sp. BMG111209]